MTLTAMLADLPTACSVGTKRNAKGHTTSWIGYKLHIDTADGDIPVSCLLTSASVHDSQVALPLAAITAGASPISTISWTARTTRPRSRKEVVRSAMCRLSTGTRGAAARRRPRLKRAPCDLSVTLSPRTSASRSEAPPNESTARSRTVTAAVSWRVRGHAKVLCHLMFGILALAVEQLMRLVT